MPAGRGGACLTVRGEELFVRSCCTAEQSGLKTPFPQNEPSSYVQNSDRELSPVKRQIKK